MPPPEVRSIRFHLWTVWLVAAFLIIAAVAQLLLAVAIALNLGGPWDVNGVVLQGGRAALFALALAGIGGFALLTALGLLRARSGARLLAIGFWVLGPGLVLLLDRLTPGAQLPLWEYIGMRMLLPAAVTAALLYLPAPARRYFGDRSG